MERAKVIGQHDGFTTDGLPVSSRIGNGRSEIGNSGQHEQKFMTAAVLAAAFTVASCIYLPAVGGLLFVGERQLGKAGK